VFSLLLEATALSNTPQQSSPIHTPLYDLHQELGAKIVPFAGYALPVQYEGVKAEHLHTRSAAGLFDVSHMGQVVVSGDQALAELEALLPLDLYSLAIGKAIYSVLPNEQGGILDDLILTRWSENTFFLVVNAACKEADVAYLSSKLTTSKIEVLTDRALVALQGPEAESVLAKYQPSIAELNFMETAKLPIAGIDCFVSRSGYTGEDGFEISIPQASATELVKKVLRDERVKPAGLGARDSLRLDAGLCLYGQDLSDELNLVQAGLWWSVSAARRPDGERAGGFPGAEDIFSLREQGADKRRVGLTVKERTPVRAGAEIVDASNNIVGSVCSGGFSPSLERPIAMAYVNAYEAKAGTQLFAKVRNKFVSVEVTPMPFVPHRYKRG